MSRRACRCGVTDTLSTTRIGRSGDETAALSWWARGAWSDRLREAGVCRGVGEAHLRHPCGDDGAEHTAAAAGDAEQIQDGLDLGRPAQGSGIAQSVRLLQVSLLREMARPHLRL